MKKLSKQEKGDFISELSMDMFYAHADELFKSCYCTRCDVASEKCYPCIASAVVIETIANSLVEESSEWN